MMIRDIKKKLDIVLKKPMHDAMKQSVHDTIG